MNIFIEIPKAARIYVAVIVVLGFCGPLPGMFPFLPVNPAQFAAYLAVCVAASILKVNLPTITGTMSVNALLFVVALVQLPERETMLIGCVGVLTQCLWKPKSRVVPIRVVFSLAANALALWMSYWVFERPFLADHLEGIRVLATACCYFVLNTGFVAIVVALTERKPVRIVWTECYFWCFPYFLGGAGIAWISIVLNRSFDWRVTFVLLPIVFFVYRSYQLYLHGLAEDKRHVEEMAGLHLRTVEALALAIEAKDKTTHDHLRRVRIYACELGTRMGLDARELQSLRAAALLHDIGKLAVPEHIISKPGKLTQEEFEKMKIHPTVGAQILEQVQFPYPVAPIVLAHHEKWDGSGYPNGWKGEEIPLGARILSVVDCLDALASDRQYRRALPLERAMEIVVSEAGRAFDPAVVRLLENCYVELERKAQAEPGVTARLNTEVVVACGAAPATGFAQDSGPAVLHPTVSGRSYEPVLLAAHVRETLDGLDEWCRSFDDGTEPAPVTVSEMLALYAVRLRKLIPHDAVVFYGKEQAHLVPLFCGGQNRKLFSSLRIPWGEGLSGWVADNRKSILNGNPSVEAGYLNDPAKFSTLSAALAVPVVFSGSIEGVLAIYRAERDSFSTADLELLTTVASRVSLSLQSFSTKDQLACRPTSGLSGVRGLFLKLQNEIDRCLSDRGTFALLVFELNRCTGSRMPVLSEAVLHSLAATLAGVFPFPATVAQWGTRRFALILPDTNPGKIALALQDIEFAVAVAGRQNQEKMTIAYNSAVACYPADGLEPEALLAWAEHHLRSTIVPNGAARASSELVVMPSRAGLGISAAS